MIQISCTSCRTELLLDDGFAGGVCRCKHCGTIQTVPAQLKGNASRPGPTPQPQPKPIPIQPTSGLDELAQVVASSGLSSGVHGPNARRENRPPAGRRFLIPALAAGIALVILLVLFITFGGNGPKPSSGGQDAAAGSGEGSGGGQTPARPRATKVFIDMPIEGPRVIYVVDRGDSSKPFFTALQRALTESVGSLPGDMSYQVAFWTVAGENVVFPTSGLAPGGPDAAGKLAVAMADVPAAGSSTLQPALEFAAKQRPSEIMLITGKKVITDSNFAKNAEKALSKAGNTKLHVVLIDTGDDFGLAKLAEKRGGRVVRIGRDELVRRYR